MPSTTLPVEVIIAIIQYISYFNRLYPLLFVSRAFRFEAERILYRRVNFNTHGTRGIQWPLLYDQEEHIRIGPFIQSLTFHAYYTRFYLTESKLKLLRGVLENARNLTSLVLMVDLSCQDVSSLLSEPHTFPFRLHSFITTFPVGDKSLTAFLCQQAQLIKLVWLAESRSPSFGSQDALFLSNQFLTSLQRFTCNVHSIHVLSYLPSVKYVRYSGRSYPTGRFGPFLGVEGLAIPHELEKWININDAFPNVKSMMIDDTLVDQDPPHLRYQKLERLYLILDIDDESVENRLKIAESAARSQPRLKSLVIEDRMKVWYSMVSEGHLETSYAIDGPGDDEWMEASW